MIALYLLITLQLGLNLLWLKLDQTPPAWDQAFHLKSVVLMNHFLTGQFGGNLIDLIRSFYAYPPLMYFLGAVWSLFAGLGISRITYLNSIFLALVLIGIYKLSLKILKNSRQAFLATFLFSLFPVIYDASRNFLLDLPLLTWVVWGLYFYLESNYLTHSRFSWLWTFTLILASLTKLNGFLYYLPMIAYSLYFVFKNKRLQPLINLGLGFSAFCLLVGWWYAFNWQNIILYLGGLAGQGEPLTDPSGLFNLVNWFHYFKLFFLHQLSPIPTLLILLSLIFWPYFGIEKHQRRFLFFYLTFNYVLFTLIKNKDFRFTFPLLPTISILAIANLRHAPKLVAILLFAFLGFYFVNNSFSWPIKKDFVLATPTFVFSDVEWIGIDNYPVRSPQQDSWPNETIVQDVIKLSRNKSVRVLVLINLEKINDNNLILEQTLMKNNSLVLSSVGNINRFNSPRQLAQFMKSYDFYLVPDQSYEPTPFYAINLTAYKQARDYIFANQENFELLKSYEFQAKKLYLYSK